MRVSANDTHSSLTKSIESTRRDRNSETHQTPQHNTRWCAVALTFTYSVILLCAVPSSQIKRKQCHVHNTHGMDGAVYGCWNEAKMMCPMSHHYLVWWWNDNRHHVLHETTHDDRNNGATKAYELRAMTTATATATTTTTTGRKCAN